MNSALANVLGRIGWDELYRQHVPGLASPNHRGECIALSPFPSSTDRNPSFSVNVQTGLWNDWHLGRGGNYVQFRALMEPSGWDGTEALIDYGATERRLLVEFGVINPIDPSWLASCQANLHGNLALLHQVLSIKPWTDVTLRQLGIGFDDRSGRIVIPIYSQTGELINCRMYRPGTDPKFLWHVPSATGNFLFPMIGYNEPSNILTEGEGDVISLRSLGYAAVCGTMGAGLPVPEGMWWRGKTVFVLFDADGPGREATERAVVELRELAALVRIVDLPEWPDRPASADISDYIQYLQRSGYDIAQCQRAISEMLNSSREVEMPHAVYDRAPIPVSFTEAMRSYNSQQHISFQAKVTARSEKRYMLPIAYNITCPASGHQYCRRCPMQTQFHGNARFTHDPRAPETLLLIAVNQDDQIKAYKRLHGIIAQCPDVTATTIESRDVESLLLNDGSVLNEENILDVQDSQRREAYVILPPSVVPEQNRDYDLHGFVYPHPKTQHGLFLIDHFSPSQQLAERRQFTDEELDALRVFQPASDGVIGRLRFVAQDLMDSVTLIRSREDLHLAYRTVWHSVLGFNFAGAYVDRGWIEALVIGDTRCGKSRTFRELSEFYGAGLLVDCKNQSPAGILGSVVTSQSTGERYVVAGVLPQQDGGVVGFDEFHVPRWNRQGLIEMLSSTRSEGVVRISKAASAQFRARVRSIWLANPGLGKLMADLPAGCEIISRLIHQPEDIARFDFALAVDQRDVSTDEINSTRSPAPHVFDRGASRLLISWTWTRTPETVVFGPGAEDAIIALSKAMYEKYDASIPLVEPADQRIRVAKVAVSIAAQCFSTNDGHHLLVGMEHVFAAGQLFQLFYDKPAMGYDVYSEKVRAERTISNEEEVLRLFNESFAPHGRRMAEELLRLDEFTERTFGTLIPVANMFTRNIIQVLYTNRCIRLTNRGVRESYELTPAFTQWLREYLA